MPALGEISDHGMQLPMRFVAINTIDRYLEMEHIQQKLLNVTSNPFEEFEVRFTFKYGCDGFTSDAEYQQLTKDKKQMDDKNFFVSEMVFINMTIIHPDGREENLVTNCLCNSPYSCRPLR